MRSDFAEPWHECDTGAIRDVLDRHVATVPDESTEERIVACVNALAGIPDPSKVRAVLLAAQRTRDKHTRETTGCSCELCAVVPAMGRIEP